MFDGVLDEEASVRIFDLIVKNELTCEITFSNGLHCKNVRIRKHDKEKKRLSMVLILSTLENVVRDVPYSDVLSLVLETSKMGAQVTLNSQESLIDVDDVGV